VDAVPRAGGFDARRPPQPDLIDACVHCGFCLPACPTYVLWGEEMDSPRGRIVLMDEALRGGAPLTPTTVEHFDRCLGCMACVTACPSGVQYDRLIERVRPQVERHAPRGGGERAFRRSLFEAFTHPARLRLLALALGPARRLGVIRLAERSGRRSRLAALARLAPDAPPRAARLPARFPAQGAPRGRVGLLQGCVQRVFFGRVNLATARVLQAEGFDVHVPSEPRCCGALAMHTGYEDEAIALAKRTIQALEGFDHVVVNAAGCGSAMKDYVHLLEDDPRWGDRARAFSARVRDVSELLDGDPVAPRGAMPLRVAYHDACHLAHAQGIRRQPRDLLRAIPGLKLLEPAEPDLCCGSAGLYNVLQPEAAADLGERKAANLLATGADAVAAGNPGCALQISAFLRRAGRPLPVYHPVELLDASIRIGSGGGEHP
jgi:glycolate dehydrogenase iron-sulfur subunit